MMRRGSEERTPPLPVRHVEDALRRDSAREAETVFLEHLLEIASSLPGAALRTLLRKLVAAGADTSGVAGAILAFYETGRTVDQGVNSEVIADLAGGCRSRLLTQTAAVIGHRLRGDLRAAIAVLRRGPVVGSLNFSVWEDVDGWRQMYMLQAGTTEMLAGNMTDAVVSLTAVTMQPMNVKLAFLTREAYMKLALIHAVCGDSEESVRLLKHSRAIPRTESWVEDRTDAAGEIVEALLGQYPADVSKKIVDGIPFHFVGEMWPFYLVALHRVYERAGYQEMLRSKMAVFERLPFQRQAGVGWSGSVIKTIQASIALGAGDVASAKQALYKADPSLPEVQVMEANVALSEGNLRRVLSIVHGLSPSSRGFRRFDLWRYALAAHAHFALTQFDEALSALESAANLAGGLRDDETAYFSDEVQSLARQSLPNWPEGAEAASTFTKAVTRARRTLSPKELEVLECLKTDATLKEIAEKLFISPNTLKTHIASIYRKLEARSRAQALLEAQKRGW